MFSILLDVKIRNSHIGASYIAAVTFVFGNTVFSCTLPVLQYGTCCPLGHDSRRGDGKHRGCRADSGDQTAHGENFIMCFTFGC